MMYLNLGGYLILDLEGNKKFEGTKIRRQIICSYYFKSSVHTLMFIESNFFTDF